MKSTDKIDKRIIAIYGRNKKQSLYLMFFATKPDAASLMKIDHVLRNLGAHRVTKDLKNGFVGGVLPLEKLGEVVKWTFVKNVKFLPNFHKEEVEEEKKHPVKRPDLDKKLEATHKRKA